MRQFDITGMSCAACAARIEKAVKEVDRVEVVSVNLLTNSMGIEGQASDDAIIKAVVAAGYGASVKGKKSDNDGSNDSFHDEIVRLRNRLISSLCFLAVLMYFSMGSMMFNAPLPGFFEHNHLAVALVEMLMAIVVMIINSKFFVSGYRALVRRSPNMDTLVALGATAAFGYSLVELFAMTGAVTEGNHELAAKYMDNMYFESAAMILTLITVGKLLEAMAKGRTGDALKGLMKLAPNEATVYRDGAWISLMSEELVVGDRVLVKPGETIPVDGYVLSGSSAVDESAMTGESIPVDKVEGDKVASGTINQSGALEIKAINVGSETAISRIIQMVSDAAASKAPIAKVADKVSGVFVPVVICISIVTMLVWLIAGAQTGEILSRGIAVLVISCPCALGLATPVAIMVGNGLAAKKGILFKTAEILENAGKTDIVVLDKTGTITQGTPVVTDIVAEDEETLIRFAASLERLSEHPLAKAIVSYAGEKPALYDVTEFKALSGNGVEGVINGHKILGGSLKFIAGHVSVSEEMCAEADKLAEQGKTPMLFTSGDSVLGIIAVADVIRADSREAIDELRSMGVRVVMLTGDNRKTADNIGAQAGVDMVIAGVMPDGKARYVQELQKCGRVMMCGDGINDAPALTRADSGVAIGAGTDVAIDAADIVLMKSSLRDAVAAIRISRKTLKNIHENLFWAFFYNVIGIPLAAGVYIPIFGWELSPVFGAAAMSLSSFCVVSNALRLNLFNPYDKKHDKTKKDIIELPEIKKEENVMKTMKIEGMMCGHCEASVRKALEKLEGVEVLEVSHVSGTAKINLSADIDDEVLIKAVEAQDYKVLGVD